MKPQTTLTAVLMLATAGLLFAGPLNPPPGPVAPTMKTLTEVEPRTAVNSVNTPGDLPNSFKIATPGSYYLTGNIDGSFISITANDVTLDLNGFRISNGAVVAANLARIVVRNGSVVSPQYSGVGLDSCSDCTVENIRVSNSVGPGIAVGARGTVRHCQVNQAGLQGYYSRENCRLEDCAASNCSDDGFGGSAGVQYTRCTALYNTGNGFVSGWMLTSCLAELNSGGGFVAVQQAIDCRASRNSGDGFNINGQAERCVSATNGGLGFTTSEGVVLRACRAEGNAHQGFHVLGSYAWLDSCTAYDNGGNTQAGFWISNNRCRVENCQAVSNGWGFYIDSGVTASVFVHNMASGNSAGNFSTVPAGNNVAPIINTPGQNNFSTSTPLSNIGF